MSRLSDICDGQEYKRHRLFFSRPGNVSFLLNTDGLALFHSSKKSLWPIWLVMNELPPNERYVINMVKPLNNAVISMTPLLVYWEASNPITANPVYVQICILHCPIVGLLPPVMHKH